MNILFYENKKIKNPQQVFTMCDGPSVMAKF